MTRDPERRYRIARAVWLYDRWSRAMDLPTASERHRAKIRVLGDRVLRALRNMEPEDQREYYVAINNRRAARVSEATMEKRAAITRARSQGLLATITDAERRIDDGE